MTLENVKGSGKEKSLCLMCFAEVDLVMKSLVNKGLVKCCSTGDVSPSHWPWFYCSLTFKLSQVMWCGKDCFDPFHKSLFKKFSALMILQLNNWPLEAFSVMAMVQWECGLCVATSFTCYCMYTMLLSRGLIELMDCLYMHKKPLTLFHVCLCMLIVLGAGCFFYWICAQPVGIITV